MVKKEIIANADGAAGTAGNVSHTLFYQGKENIGGYRQKTSVLFLLFTKLKFI